MRNQKVVAYLVAAGMGVSILLQGNSAFAKGVDKSIEEVGDTTILSLAGIRQDTEFRISGTTAEVQVYVRGTVNTKKISLVAKLQRKVDGKWKNVETWEKTTDAFSLNFAKTFALSSKGSYRVQATVTYQQKDGTTETKTTNSATKTYS